MSNDLNQIANRIKQCMADRGLRQVDIVKTTGVSKSSVSKWLSAKAKPSGESLLRLAEVLNKSESWLIKGEHSYISYADLDDAMSYAHSAEENQRAFYIEKLNLDPKLPYSIRFLKEKFEEKMSYNVVDHLESFELSQEHEKQFEKWSNSRSDNDFIENEIIRSYVKLYPTINEFIEKFKYSTDQALSHLEIAKQANASLEKTLFYMQSDQSMEPTITIGAQCSIDLTKREIKNGQLYLILRNNFLGLRALFSQSDGSLLLKCKNGDYPDEKIPQSEMGSLEVLGYVYAWSNINPW